MKKIKIYTLGNYNTIKVEPDLIHNTFIIHYKNAISGITCTYKTIHIENPFFEYMLNIYTGKSWAAFLENSKNSYYKI